jgi:hypothetical protein
VYPSSEFRPAVEHVSNDPANPGPYCMYHTVFQLESALLRLSRQILHPLSRSANRTGNTTIPRDGTTNNGNTEENSANAYGGASNGNLGSNGVAGDLGEMEIPDVQVTIRSGQNMLQFRELTVSRPSSATGKV